MKTPEEIKKGLKLCSHEGHGEEIICEHCPYDSNSCAILICTRQLSEDALAYIQQLESELAAVKRERDAACNVIKQMAGELDIPACGWCKGNLFNTFDPSCRKCRTHNEGFEWRGVCPENTEVQDDD